MHFTKSRVQSAAYSEFFSSFEMKFICFNECLGITMKLLTYYIYSTPYAKIIFTDFFMSANIFGCEFSADMEEGCGTPFVKWVMEMAASVATW